MDTKTSSRSRILIGGSSGVRDGSVVCLLTIVTRNVILFNITSVSGKPLYTGGCLSEPTNPLDPTLRDEM